ncbi:hypothetical protein [Actinoallomurus rhizosphaericola]|uniref:hypothetical protein n=1 Tax=Actinoallomurus rhizosphaericola TaxID=2952536 RepID=UPI002092E7A0|nr:hypothetical protein [Actinoallomurus rhizosphaericola]MCO5999267.1 hypothetical protein [Actinoallomurus rhizosphaericola]
MLPITPQRASACDIGIGYRTPLNINKPDMGRSKPCSTGASLTGVAVVAILTIGSLATAGLIAFRRGIDTARPDQALTDYLHATGLVSPAAHVSSEASDTDPNT